MGYGQRPFEMRLINKVLLFSAAMAVSSSLKAQGGSCQNFTQSPYSNFGVGEWTGMNFTQAGANMHTFSGAYSHSLTNPATLGNLRYAAFNMGVAYRGGDVQTEAGERQTFNGGGMQYLSLGYPTWTYDKRTKLEDSAGKKTYKSTPYGILSAISLSPLTTVGYRYAFENNEPFLNRTTHTGSGGLNNLQWSHAGHLGKHVNLGYSVGQYLVSCATIPCSRFLTASIWERFKIPAASLSRACSSKWAFCFRATWTRTRTHWAPPIPGTPT